MFKPFIEHIKEKTPQFSWRRIWIVVCAVVVLFGVFVVGMISYADTYHGRVLPGVFIGDVPIGGLDRAGLREYLEQTQSKLINDGVQIQFDTGNGKKSFVIIPRSVSDEDVIDFFSFDIEKEIDTLLDYGKSDTRLAQAWAALSSRLFRSHLALQYVSVDKERLSDEIKEKVSP